MVIEPSNIPEGAVFKGYCPYIVQNIRFAASNTRYLLERWRLPDGSYIKGELPKDVHGHYGAELISYILHQYHACRVTEHLLLEQLHSIGILISAGQLNNILTENKEKFVEEVAELLPTAVKIDNQLAVDDTGGRHKGKNQYTTIIGNRWFSFFATTDSKSRINFLQLLQGGKREYIINEDTLSYLKEINASEYLLGYISLHVGSVFTTSADWEKFLKEWNITAESDKRFLTEAALYASVIER